MLNVRYIAKLHQMKVNNTLNNSQAFNPILCNYIQIYEKILLKSKKEFTTFGTLITSAYDMVSTMHRESKFLFEYENSIKTGQYYPTATFFT